MNRMNRLVALALVCVAIAAQTSFPPTSPGAVSETNLQRLTCVFPATNPTGGTDAYSVTLDPALETDYDDVCLIVTPDVANTGAATLNGGLGAEPIKTNDDADPPDNFIPASRRAIFAWDPALDSGMGAWAVIGGGAIVNNNTINNVTEVTQEVLYTNLNVTSGSIRVANQTPTGTEVNHLASLTGAPSTAIESAAAATSGVIGVVTSGAGTTGQSRITIFGDAVCDFTNATTAGNYVQVSATVAGECQDMGSSPPTSGGLVLGRVKETGAAGNRTMLVNIQPVNSSSSGILETHEASSSATLDFTTCLTEPYDDFKVVVSNLHPETDNVTVLMLFSTDGGMTWVGGTSYAWVGNRASVGGSANNQGSNGTSSFSLSSLGTIDNAANVGTFDAVVHIQHPAGGTSYTSVYVIATQWDGQTNPTVGSQMAGKFLSATAVNAFQIKFSSGDIASGTVSCGPAI